MKKLITPFLLFIVSTISWAQLVTTTPAFITQDAGAIDIIFDATLGTGGLKDYTGDIYAHTGVITTDSKDGSDWKHAPTWGDNAAKYKLTSLGSNKWKLSITPSMTSYYGLTTGEQVTKLVFVFRSGVKVNGNYLEGKDVGGSDIFVNVFQSGSLNISITNPPGDKSVSVGTSMNIGVATSASVTTLELYINGTVVKTANASSTLNYTYTFATAGDYTIIAKATQYGQSVRDTVLVCAPSPVTTEARPSGVKDGINYNPSDNTTATLVMYAPLKSNIFVIGEFNNWTQLNAYQLKKDGDYWWITLTGLTPGKVYGFQYLVDGVLRVSDAYTEMVLDPWNDKWINEKTNIYPNLKAYPVGKTEGLVATLQTAKPTYNWEVANFTAPALENMVIYELLLRDFTPEKSLDAALTKLDYLQTLGVTAIELMPIQEFDGNNSWGYNPNHYFATDKAYGTSETYKKFIDECHKRGMAVIVDVVFNHATGSNPFAKLYWNSTTSKTADNNPWFNVDATHPYSVFHDFNHSFTGTKEYFKRVLQYWITEYKVDGYRLDLTKGFSQKVTTEATASTYDQSRIDNLSTYYDAAKAVKSNVMFILEHFCEYSEELALANKGMYLWREVNDAYSQTAMGYQSSSDFSAMISTPRRWVGFAESHDKERNFFKAKQYGDGTIKTDSLVRIARVPLNIAFTTLLPGPKMVWQFGEIGYDNSIDSFGGRTNEKPSPWGWFTLAHRKAAYDAASKIISLRKLYPTAFTQGTFSTQVSTNDWASGRRIALTHNDLNMVVVGNFQNTGIQTSPNFPKTGLWYNLFTGASLSVSNTNMSLSLQAGEVAIYTDREISFTNAVEEVIKQSDIKVYPSITQGKIFLSTSDNNVSLYTSQGILLMTGKQVTEIDLTNYTSGLYILNVNSMTGNRQFKIIKQ